MKGYSGYRRGAEPVNDMHDLRHHHIDPDSWTVDEYEKMFGSRSRNHAHGGVTTHFGDLTPALCKFIEDSEVVVGCVAWLTAKPILSALEGRRVQIVVQKEDFLRPDLTPNAGLAKYLRQAYGRIHGGLVRYEFPHPLRDADSLDFEDMDAVRCVGNHNSEKSPSRPRMHHKFLVRLEQNYSAGDEELVGSTGWFRPLAVWTGSFNFSAAAGKSFENAIEIHDTPIATDYFSEYLRVASLSEPLDWESEWAMPEWRIGT